MNKVQEFAFDRGITNVFHYAAAEEKCIFERQAEENGYERKTTFFSDLSIAEWYGVSSVRDTFNNVVSSWLSDVEYFTEFVMSLNLKIWEWYDRGDEELARLYDELWRKADAMACDKYKGEDADYFFRTLD